MGSEYGNGNRGEGLATRALTAPEQEVLRAAIAVRGASGVARAIGISVDAMTLAAAGGGARAGTNAAIRVWLSHPADGDSDAGGAGHAA
jgi:hypothetical protein